MLDDIDRFSMYYTIKKIGNSYGNDGSIPITEKIDVLSKVLKSPFFGKRHFDLTNEGTIYGSYVYYYNPEMSNILNNKLLTYKLFQKNHINHPKLYLTIENKKINYINDINPNTNYIVKPINGSLGFSIELLNGKDIIKNIHNWDNILVQQYLYDCTTNNKARHFRFISFYDGTPFRVFELSSKDKIVSNAARGGSIQPCYSLKCDFLSKKQQFILESFMKKLQDLHIKKFNKVFSIGWDIVFYCENGNIKIACLEGNIHHTSWVLEEKDTDYIDDLLKLYKDKYRYFINNKQYI